MTDTISSGRTTPPRHRGWPIVLLVVALVGAAVWYGTTRGRGGRHAATTPASTSASSSTSVPSSPATLTPADFRNHLIGAPLRGRTGLRMYLLGPREGTGPSLVALDVDSRRQTPLPSLAQQHQPWLDVIGVRGGVVVRHAWCAGSGCPSGADTVSVLAGGKAQSFPDPGVTIATADGSGLWAGRGVGTSTRLQQVDLSMRAVSPAVTLPPGAQPIADTVDGLLLQTSGNQVLIWDPRTRRVVASRSGTVLAASPGTVVLRDPPSTGCPYGCAVSILRLGQRQHDQFDSLGIIGQSLRPDLGSALSPDGRYFAVCTTSFAEVDPDTGAVLPGRAGVEVFDLATLRPTVLGSPSLYLSVPPPNLGLDFAQHSDWLTLSAYDTAEHRSQTTIALWKPGMAAPQIAAVVPGREQVAVVE